MTKEDFSIVVVEKLYAMGFKGVQVLIDNQEVTVRAGWQDIFPLYGSQVSQVHVFDDHLVSVFEDDFMAFAKGESE